MEIKGFLFGHYDSRGGATFIETECPVEARRRYAKCFIYYKDAGWSYEEYEQQLYEEDIIAKAIIECDERPAKDTDIESGWQDDYDFTTIKNDEYPSTLWEPKGQRENFDANEAPAPDFYLRLKLTKPSFTPPEGMVPTEYGEDAFGVIFNPTEIENNIEE